jgi:hypothetical protein
MRLLPDKHDKPLPEPEQGTEVENTETPATSAPLAQMLDEATRPRTRQSLRFLLERLHSGEGDLPQPYADLLSLEFWDALPTREDLSKRGLGRGFGRGFGLSDDLRDPNWQQNMAARMDMQMNMWAVRDVFINRFTFAIPARETLEAIVEHSRSIVEVGAGTGFWARLLTKAGADVVATDLKSDLMQGGVNFDVIDMDGREAVKANPDRDLLTCWPHMDATWLTTALSHLQPGRFVFYIGEWGGCTGHESTRQALKNETLFEEIGYSPMVQFAGIHDDLHIYRRTSHDWIRPKFKETTSTSRQRRREKRRKSSGNDAARTTGSSASGEGSTSGT